MQWLYNYVTTTLLASTAPPTNDITSTTTMEVTSLARYAVKGLSPDMLRSVHIATDGEGTFPDDRRFALLRSKIAKHKDNDDDDGETGEGTEEEEAVRFDGKNPEWIHKQNFLCAFTVPELMATLDCEYRIVTTSSRDSDTIDNDTSSIGSTVSYGLPNDDIAQTNNTNDTSAVSGTVQRLLTIWKRRPTTPSTPTPTPTPEPSNKSTPTTAPCTTTTPRTSTPLLGPIDLTTSHGRSTLASFFADLSQTTDHHITCVCQHDDDSHTHQFGNTRAGVKHNNGDTRTVHIVNAATVRQVSETIGIPLDPMRFRPNLVVDGLEPWREFDMVGRKLRVVPSSCSGNDDDEEEESPSLLSSSSSGMELDVLSTTVRCAGIGIDPLDPMVGTLDMPVLLAKHFPERGPYLGVYATVRTRGVVNVGDRLQLVPES